MQFAGHSAEVLLTAFLPDGRRLISATGQDQTARLWDVDTGRQLACWAGDWRPPFTVEGTTLLASAGPNRIGRWEALTGRRLPDRRIVDAPSNPFAHKPMMLGLSPDGRTLVSVSDNNTGDGAATVSIQETETGKPLVRRQHRLPFSQIQGGWPTPVLSPDRRLVAETDERLISARDVATGSVFRTLVSDGPGQESFLAESLVFAPDGRLLACARMPPGLARASRIHVWELATGQELAPIPVPCTPALAFSSDSRLLASAAHDLDGSRKGEARIQVWDAATGQELARFGGQDAFVNSLAFSSDNSRLATGLTDSTVLLWDLGPALRDAASAARIPGREDFARHWAALASEDVRAAYKAVAALAAAPAGSLPFLRQRIKPAAGVKAARLRQLVADLDSEQFAARRAATAELENLDTLAESALEDALRQPTSLERRRRADELLQKLRRPVSAPEVRRAVRVVAVLEQVGTPEARRLLKQLAEGAPGARLTRESAGALERLEKRIRHEKANDGRWPSGSALFP